MGFIHSWGKQLRKPEGILGKVVVPFFMNVANRQLNNWTIDLLHIKPTDHVLELGFGRVEHRRSKFRLRTFRFQPFRLLVPKSLKPCPCFLCPL
jgi:hypothetical protein